MLHKDKDAVRTQQHLQRGIECSSHMLIVLNCNNFCVKSSEPSEMLDLPSMEGPIEFLAETCQVKGAFLRARDIKRMAGKSKIWINILHNRPQDES